MAARQEHGFKFENKIHRVTHGKSKKEYDKLINGGHIAELDLQEGVLVDFNAHVKTTKSNSVGGSDLLRMYIGLELFEVIIIVGKYKEYDGKKEVFEIYEFYVNPSHHQLFWGGMQLDTLKEFDSYVVNIEKGREAQKINQPIWKDKRDKIYEDECRGLMSINAKIGSTTQRRVQCGFLIHQAIEAGIPYKKFTDEYRGVSNFLPTLI